MTKSEFWKQLELKDSDVAFETGDYLVVVTPRMWREQARAETDRNLLEFSVVNKTYWTIESGSNNLMTAIITAETMQDGLVKLTKKEPPSAQIIGFPSKDNAE